MFDQIVGLLLIGLGIKTPNFPPGTVKGDQTEISVVEENKAKIKNDTEAILKDRLELKNALKEKDYKVATSANKALQVDKNVRREDAKEIKKEVLDARKAAKDAFIADVQSKREAAKKAFETQRAAFKKNLEKIKDTKKKEIVTNADKKLSEINTNRTKIMSEHVGRIEDTIIKISEKATVLKSEGKDTSGIETKLSQAQAMVSSVKSLISGQAAKEYVIGVTTETGLRTDVGRAMDALQRDLKIVQDSVASLRATVQDAIKAMALLYDKTEGISQ